MRRTIQRLASVKPARYMDIGTPTGLAGLRTHGSPRSTLLFLYASTLEKLKAGGVPEHSAYRQSVEALTKHRMAIVQAEVPPGHEAWLESARKVLKEELQQGGNGDGESEIRETFHVAGTEEQANGGSATRVVVGDDVFVVRHTPPAKDVRLEEWDGEPYRQELEGTRSAEEREAKDAEEEGVPLNHPSRVRWEPEPQLTAEQIESIEAKIGAGLIEEVIQVAEGELRLVDTMVQSKVWESLEEKPSEGQWVYFERKA